ncbi:DUF2975 domain-containing protein [Sphingomonas sp. UV9]|uniref:DUF2975 domain-containing protein n=1 Tax=Sphingomonas sp. UV9 TaxID=1851410 RepID=UPI000FFB703F|nr:DUF2975 domain-containing protein [Sphingomonas sp. UV9]RXD05467.1 DUF2975 domain-containing protein [Sphingomonas sp. UV9]
MQDRFLGIARGLLRFANGANWTSAIGFAVAIVLSFVFGDALTAQIALKYHGRHVPETVAIIRLLGVLSIVAAIAVHQLLTRLIAIVESVRVGDPFVAANADRLQRIGWALLALQLLDLVLGGITVFLNRINVDFVTWTPSFTGWIGVVMIFVLARVFRLGAAMRDDLAMTV